MGTMDNTTLTLRAILVYCVYRTSDMYRRQGNGHMDGALQAMQQFAKEAVRGHTQAKGVLKSGYYNRNGITEEARSRLEDLLEEFEDA